MRGANGLLLQNGISIHKGRATLAYAHRVSISKGEIIYADTIILAVGSLPAIVPFEGYDLPGVIDSTGALNLAELPKSICILGGGVIGSEFAQLFSAFHVKVTIVEMMPQILPTVDG